MATRKVRTLAGVRFFDAPIGTPITPGMVKAAKEKYGEKKTESMLHAQRRNSVRDERRLKFQNAAVKRHEARENRVAQNALNREMKNDPVVQAFVPDVKPRPNRAVVARGRVGTDAEWEAIFNLLEDENEWTEAKRKRAIALRDKFRPSPDEQERGLAAELHARLARALVEKGIGAKVRRVRTLRGSKVFGQPIGTIITRDMIERAKREGRLGGGERHGAGGGRNIRTPVGHKPAVNKPRVGVPKKVNHAPKARAKAPVRDPAIAHESKIRRAQNEKDLISVINDIDADDSLSADTADRLLDAAEARFASLNKPKAAPKKAPEKPAARKPVPKAPDKPNAPEKAGKERQQGGFDAAKAMELLRVAERADHVDIVERMVDQNKGKMSSEDYDRLKRAAADRRAKFQREKEEADKKRQAAEAAERAKNSPNEVLGGYERRMERAMVERDFSEVDDIIDEMMWDQRLSASEKHDFLMKHSWDYRDQVRREKAERNDPAEKELVTGDKITPAQRKRLTAAKNNRWRDAALIRYMARRDALSKKPENTPAGKVLHGGGAIEDVKDPEGLEQYIDAFPDRFVKKTIDAGQVSEAFTVYDKATKKQYFFKRASNNGAAHMYGDGVNEVMAAQLGRAAFPDIFPNVVFAERPDADGNPLIRMDHIDEFTGEKAHTNAIERWDARRERGRFQAVLRDDYTLGDPTDALTIHIFDYLINQTDRHPGNYGWVGGKLVPLDNGAAFHAYDNLVQRNAKGAVPKNFVFEPENVGYGDWAGVYVFNRDVQVAKGYYMAMEAAQAYAFNGASRDQIKADAEKVIEKFRKVKYDQIVEMLEKQFPSMSAYEKDHMRAAALIWKKRLAALNADDVADVIGGGA